MDQLGTLELSGLERELDRLRTLGWLRSDLRPEDLGSNKRPAVKGSTDQRCST
jgi:hypothetical protein